MVPQFNLEAFIKLFGHVKVKQSLLDSAKKKKKIFLFWSGYSHTGWQNNLFFL